MTRDKAADLAWGIALLVAITGLGVLMDDDPTYKVIVGAAFAALAICALICGYRWFLARDEAQLDEFRKRVGG